MLLFQKTHHHSWIMNLRSVRHQSWHTDAHNPGCSNKDVYHNVSQSQLMEWNGILQERLANTSRSTLKLLDIEPTAPKKVKDKMTFIAERMEQYLYIEADSFEEYTNIATLSD